MAAPVDDPKWRIFCVARIKPVGEGEAAAVVQESATQLSVPHPDDDDEEGGVESFNVASDIQGAVLAALVEFWLSRYSKR